MAQTTGRRRGPLKKVLVGLGVLFVIVVLALGIVLLATESQRREDRSLEIARVDFTKVPDGIYRGGYKGWNKFDVVVTVSAGKVTKITIDEATSSPPTDITMRILDRIIKEQSLEVDAVSGATVTTKGLLRAVEVALVEQRTE